MTAQELERVTIPGKVTELIRGRLVVHEPPSTLHGRVSARLTVRLGEFVFRHGLGEMFAQDTGFKIESKPDTVRAPDLAFVSRERTREIPARGYAPLTPDLVVEIRSPDDRTGEVLAKVAAWLDSGARLLWVIDPERAEAQVYRPDGSVTIVGADGALNGEDVLPGFACALAEIIA